MVRTPVGAVCTSECLCPWQETSEAWLVPTPPGGSQRTSHYLLCFHILR